MQHIAALWVGCSDVDRLGFVEKVLDVIELAFLACLEEFDCLRAGLVIWLV
jgi:hypothetical protein